MSETYQEALETCPPDDPVLELILAAQMLHDDCAEYGRVNHLGGYDNRAMARVRAAINHAWRAGKRRPETDEDLIARNKRNVSVAAAAAEYAQSQSNSEFQRELMGAAFIAGVKFAERPA